MDYSVNIYEELNKCKELIKSLQSKVYSLETEVKILKETKEQGITKVASEFYVVDDILDIFKISETTLYKWKKLARLKTAGKNGKKTRYNKKNVELFFDEIEKLKITNPEYFDVAGEISRKKSIDYPKTKKLKNDAA